MGRKRTTNPSNSMGRDPDIALIQNCLTGKQTAWDELVEKVSSFVYYCIHKVTRGCSGEITNEDIQDMFQNVFLALYKDDYRKLRSYRGESKFTTWLSFVIRSVCVDYLRKEKKRSRMSLDEPIVMENGKENTTLTHGEMLVDKTETVLRQLEKTEMQEIVNSVLEELPARERIIIRLFYEGDKKYREIADIMDIPENTVASALSRVKVNLKSKLEKKLEMSGPVTVASSKTKGGQKC